MAMRLTMLGEGCRQPAAPPTRAGTDDHDPRAQDKVIVPLPRRGGPGSPFAGRRPPVLLDNHCRIP